MAKKGLGTALAALALDMIQADAAVKYDESDLVDPVTFAESPWGLNRPLFPVQRVIIKAHYGIALDDNPYGLDLEQPVPLGHPKYEEITYRNDAIPDDPENGYYKHRVVISTDYKRTKQVVMTEAGYLRYLYEDGRSNIREVIPGEQRRELVLCLGRRSGKSELAALITAYETYKLIQKGCPQQYYGLPTGEKIMMAALATGKDQAKILFQKVSGYYRGCDYFSPYTANATQSYIKFQTPYDIERHGSFAANDKAMATLEITFKPTSGKAVRGFGYVVVVLDEMAFFPDAGEASAENVYTSIKPSQAAFSKKDPANPKNAIGEVEGRIICISSPKGRQGYFFQIFQEALTGGGPSGKGVLAIQAPTWEVNPSVAASELVKERYRNATVFDTEYGASFSDRTAGWLEPSDLLDRVDPKARPKMRGQVRVPHFVGLDFGLATDATSIAIGHHDQDGKLIVDLVERIMAGEGKYENVLRLDFEEVADWVLSFNSRFMFYKGMFDSWSGIIFEQALHKRGLKMLESSRITPQEESQMYQNFKNLLWGDKIVLYDYPRDESVPDGHCPYIQELLELQAEYKSKTVTEVKAPNMPGKHDDMADALVRMSWIASQSLTNQASFGHKGRAVHPLILPGNRGSARSFDEIYKQHIRRKRGYGTSSDRRPSQFNRGAVAGRR